MAFDFLQNGLLGMGGLGGGQNDMPANALLGGFYDPKAMRNYQMKQMLLGLGAGLLAEKGFGKGAAMGIAAGDLAGRTYRDNAMDAYKLKQQADQQTYERGKDAKDEAYRNKLLGIQIAQEGRAAEAEQRQRDQQTAADSAWGNIRKMPSTGVPVQNYGMADQLYKMGKVDDAIDMVSPDQPGAGDGVKSYAPIPYDMGGGKIGYGIPLENGSFVPVQAPNGGQFLGPFDKAYMQASGRSQGDGAGDATVTYRSMMSKMPGVEGVVKQLDDLAEKATYTLAGQAYNASRTQLGFSPTEGAVARTQYQAMVANQVLPLLRDTFGAQFTQVEGERLLSTLGDPDKSPQEKQAVLKAFIEQKRRDVEALAMQAGVQPMPQGQSGNIISPADAAAPRVRKYNPATGKIE